MYNNHELFFVPVINLYFQIQIERGNQHMKS